MKDQQDLADRTRKEVPSMLGDVNKIPMIFPGSSDIRRNRSKNGDNTGAGLQRARDGSPSCSSFAPRALISPWSRNPMIGSESSS